MLRSSTSTSGFCSAAAASALNEFAPRVEQKINYKDWTFKSLKDGAPVNLREWSKGKKLVAADRGEAAGAGEVPAGVKEQFAAQGLGQIGRVVGIDRSLLLAVVEAEPGDNSVQIRPERRRWWWCWS